MPKVFLHLGAHKTATTFLQANWVANRPAFAKQGWQVIYFQNEMRRLRKHVLAARKIKPLSEQAQKEMDDYFAQLRADPRDIFFSSEIFLGQMSLRKGVIYPHHASAIKHLKNEFAGRNVKVAFCIRNFADYLESGYSWLVKRGKAERFKAYAKHAKASTLSWLNIIECLSDTFGPENLVLWTYEDFRTDSSGAYFKILKAAGLDTSEFSVELEKPKNVSHPPEVVEAIQRWNKARRSGPREKRSIRKKELRAFIAQLPRSGDAKPLLGSKRRDQLNDRYDEELAQIRQRWGAQMLDFTPQS